MEEKELYQVDDKAMESQLENFNTIFDANGEDIAYSDESFNKVIVNFVGIEISCSKCYSSFPSKSKLYKHIKAGCIKKALPSFST